MPSETESSGTTARDNGSLFGRSQVMVGISPSIMWNEADGPMLHPWACSARGNATADEVLEEYDT